MSVTKVKDYFKQYGMEQRVLEFDVSSATVELAAKAVGWVDVSKDWENKL